MLFGQTILVRPFWSDQVGNNNEFSVFLKGFVTPGNKLGSVKRYFGSETRGST